MLPRLCRQQEGFLSRLTDGCQGKRRQHDRCFPSEARQSHHELGGDSDSQTCKGLSQARVLGLLGWQKWLAACRPGRRRSLPCTPPHPTPGSPCSVCAIWGSERQALKGLTAVEQSAHILGLRQSDLQASPAVPPLLLAPATRAFLTLRFHL